MNLLVIGESCVDIFNYGNCNRLAPEAPVPVFNVESTSRNMGMAGNVYNNIKSLLLKEKFMHWWNVDLITNQNWEHIKKIRYVEDRSNHMFIRVDENDNMYTHLNVRNIDLKKYDAVIISDYNKGCLSESDIEYISKNHPLTIIDTKKRMGDWIKGVTCVKVNTSEYNMNKEFIDNNIKGKTIITLGKQGCMFRDKIYEVPEVAVKDVAGAGDSFLAGFSVFYVNTRSFDAAIAKGNECSTAVVQKRGVSVV